VHIVYTCCFSQDNLKHTAAAAAATAEEGENSKTRADMQFRARDGRNDEEAGNTVHGKVEGKMACARYYDLRLCKEEE